MRLLSEGSSSTASTLVDATQDIHKSRLELQMILVNAYHLGLRPSVDAIEKLGGLHQFMNWDKAILTDSGGFQAFALSKFVRYEESGIRFRSHLDGSEIFLTPETVIDGQQRLGVDIATCLDVCTGFPATEQEVGEAVDQTNDWAEASVRQMSKIKSQMLLYGMVQGSIYPDLRKRSAEFLSNLPFSGYAIGGNMYTFGDTIDELAKEKPQMWETVAYTTSILPQNKPRHLLGVGEPSDLIAGVAAGVDTFDCVMATRIARHGSGWVHLQVQPFGLNQEPFYERINFAASRYRLDDGPIDPLCSCPACGLGYTRAYLQHLCKIGDPLVGQLLSIHNVAFLMNLMGEIRTAIAAGSFNVLASEHVK